MTHDMAETAKVATHAAGSCTPLRAETEHDVASWRTATKTAAGLATCRFTARSD